MIESANVLLDGLDENSITSLLNKWKEITEVRKSMDLSEEMIKNKIKVFMKEKDWKRYMDEESKISINISCIKRETINTDKLKLMLSQGQLSQITTITTSERMTITTPEAREKMKKFLK